MCTGFVTPEVDYRKNQHQFKVVQYTPEVYATLPALKHMDWQEKRCLEFFLQRTAPEIEGCFTPILWYEFLQLATNTENPIRHAILAVASMHEHYVTSGRTTLPQLKYSMTHYNKALREVSELDVTKQEHAIDQALAACVLFSCVEGLRGHYQSLISHLRSGMKIMYQAEAEKRTIRHSYLSHEMLQQLFTRVNVQLMAMGNDCLLSQNCTWHLTAIPETFTSASEAMFALEEFYCSLMHFYQSLGQDLKSTEISNEQTQSIRNQHQQYKDHYDQFIRSSMWVLRSGPLDSPQPLHQLPPEALILTITSLSASIALDIDTKNGEMDFDRFEERFRNMVTACGVFLYRTSMGTGYMILDNDSSWRDCLVGGPQPSRHSVKSDSTREPADQSGFGIETDAGLVPTFSMRLGVVPHLYWAAARCRHPLIRRRALQLLLTCNRREGLWDSKICGRIAERVISVEEKAALSHKAESYPDEQCVLTSSSDVPGHLRITVQWSKFEAGNKIKICYENVQAREEVMETLEL